MGIGRSYCLGGTSSYRLNAYVDAAIAGALVSMVREESWTSSDPELTRRVQELQADLQLTAEDPRDRAEAQQRLLVRAYACRDLNGYADLMWARRIESLFRIEPIHRDDGVFGTTAEEGRIDLFFWTYLLRGSSAPIADFVSRFIPYSLSDGALADEIIRVQHANPAANRRTAEALLSDGSLGDGSGEPRGAARSSRKVAILRASAAADPRPVAFLRGAVAGQRGAGRWDAAFEGLLRSRFGTAEKPGRSKRTTMNSSLAARAQPALLALDIDGTLFGEDAVIPPRNIRALVNLRERGISVVLSSGRALVSIRGVADRMFPPRKTDYYIAFNGGIVAGNGQAEAIWAPTVPPPVVREIADYAREHQVVLQGYQDPEFLVERDSSTSRSYSEGTGMGYRVVQDLARELPSGTPKLLMIAPHEDLLEHQERLEALARIAGPRAREAAGGVTAADAGAARAAGDGPAGPRFEMTFSKPHYLEIMPPGVTKGAGLRRLCEHLGIPLRETVAVGDSLNDVEMLREAGIGVAVANADDRVKRAADHTTTASAEEAAVAEVIDRFFP